MVDTDKVARELLEVVPAVMSTIRREMRRRRRSDLSVMQFRTLVYINLNPGTSLSALADHLGLSLPTVSQMVHALVEKGVVSRQDSASDRRCVMLSLTSKGEILLEKSLSGTQAHLAETLSKLESEEVEAVHRVMLLLEALFCQSIPSHSQASKEQP